MLKITISSLATRLGGGVEDVLSSTLLECSGLGPNVSKKMSRALEACQAMKQST